MLRRRLGSLDVFCVGCGCIGMRYIGLSQAASLPPSTTTLAELDTAFPIGAASGARALPELTSRPEL